MTQLCFGTFTSVIQRTLQEDPLWWNQHVSIDVTSAKKHSPRKLWLVNVILF